MKEPESMDECIYFTNRTFDKGKAKTWVLKEKCEKCGQALMGKPRNPKTGRPKIRATEYVCPKCNHAEEKEEYESKLTANIKYTCPHCSNEGEAEIPFKRKKIQRLNKETGKKKAVEVLRFQCSKCGENIDISKKLK